MDEVVDFLLNHSSRVLALKDPGIDIEHTQTRILLLELNADGLQQVGLAHTRRAEDKQGVVCLHLGVIGNGLTDAHS